MQLDNPCPSGSASVHTEIMDLTPELLRLWKEARPIRTLPLRLPVASLPPARLRFECVRTVRHYVLAFGPPITTSDIRHKYVLVGHDSTMVQAASRKSNCQAAPTRAPAPIRLQRHLYLSGNSTPRSKLQMVVRVCTSVTLPWYSITDGCGA